MKKQKIIDGKWKVIETDERGGQGQVYRVCNEEYPDQLFALKYLNKQNDDERRARMHREVENVKKLSNDHLMKVIYSNAEQYNDVKEKLYYVSPFIIGGTLEEYVKKNEVEFSEAIEFFISFLEVILYCHEQGILHRDIKPDNVLLNEGILNQFVLIDFGLSFNLEETETLTATSQQMGNRFLLLPELVSGTKEEKRFVESDLSQSCALLFYVLTGIVPNALTDGNGMPPHKRENAKKILTTKIDNEVIRNNITLLFDKAFANNIEERYHSADEILTVLKSIREKRVNSLGGRVMNNEVILGANGSGVESYKYSELMRGLNPSTEIYNPSGLTMPLNTNVVELVDYGIAMPEPIRQKIVYYYQHGDYVTAANTIWVRAINILRKRILSLGEEFVADMVDTDDLEYVCNLPSYRTIILAYDLGFIDKSGTRKLQMANEYYNYYNNDESDEYEEMPQDEANIIIKNSIGYILYNNENAFGLQFNDFREKLKTGRVTELYEDDKVMFATCPYFYLKTSVRSLLKLFGETEGIEYENVVTNMNIMFPIIWERLKTEERRALADAYTDYTNNSDYMRVDVLNSIMLQVHGFDYVKENIRSRTYIQVARKLRDVHFEINNFHKEPTVIMNLEDLGTVIPKPALKDCITSVLFVKLGNSYGISWAAEEIADRIMERLTNDEWGIYLEKYMIEEEVLLDLINDCMPMRKRWKELVRKFELKNLNVTQPRIKKLLSIK